VDRLRRAEANMSNSQHFQLQLRDFLDPTRSCVSSQPTINKYYVENFALQDHYNQRLSILKFRSRICTVPLRIFISLIQTAVIQTHVLLVDYMAQSPTNPKVDSDLATFAANLCSSLGFVLDED
jgi:hypothetical protein